MPLWQCRELVAWWRLTVLDGQGQAAHGEADRAEGADQVDLAQAGDVGQLREDQLRRAKHLRVCPSQRHPRYTQGAHCMHHQLTGWLAHRDSSFAAQLHMVRQ